MLLDELMTANRPLESVPARTAASKSPPWAPTPGISSGIPGHVRRTVSNCWGEVAPATNPTFPL